MNVTFNKTNVQDFKENFKVIMCKYGGERVHLLVTTCDWPYPRSSYSWHVQYDCQKVIKVTGFRLKESFSIIKTKRGEGVLECSVVVYRFGQRTVEVRNNTKRKGSDWLLGLSKNLCRTLCRVHGGVWENRETGRVPDVVRRSSVTRCTELIL